MEKYNWGIIGTGNIACSFAESLQRVNGEVYGAYNRHIEKAQNFAEKYQVLHVYENLDDLLNDENIHVVYVSTPHNAHYEMIIKALKAHKHVLCEKAITVNDRQLEEAVKLAKKNDLILMEAMTVYHMPLYKQLRIIVDSGKIGKIKMIQVNFGSCKEYDVHNRFFSKELAGGALLDIGVYATAFARYFLKSCPNTLITTNQYFETGVDEQSGIIMKNQDGQMVVMALSMRAKQPKRGVIAGEDGYIEINDYPRASQATITYTIDGHKEEISVGETSLGLDYEITDMQNAIIHNNEQTIHLTRDVMKLLTEIRTQWGMIYPFE